MGSNDPCLNVAHKTDFRIARMWVAWKKEDPPAYRVKPIPILVIRHIECIAQHLPAGPAGDKLQTAANSIIVFFFLFRPGEYTNVTPDTTPFTLGDVQLSVGDTRLDVLTTPELMLFQAHTASLTFTTQKNGVKTQSCVKA